MYIFQLSVNISLQNVINTALSVSLLSSLFSRQNESTAYLIPHFLEEKEISQFVSFHHWHTRSTLQSSTFINHSIKHKVVIFVEFLKHTSERVNFSKVRGLEPATSVTINTFTGVFQRFCLI